MKYSLVLITGFSMLFLGISSCNSKNDSPRKESEAAYPITTSLGERTCPGKIVSLPNPPSSPTEPALPGMVLGLETDSEGYILTCNGHWQFREALTVDGETYSPAYEGKVEVTGPASITRLSASQEYFELEIETIRKCDPSE